MLNLDRVTQGFAQSGFENFQVLFMMFLHGAVTHSICVYVEDFSLCSSASQDLYGFLLITILIFLVAVTKQTAEPLVVKHQL